jgi:hypothetical protein
MTTPRTTRNGTSTKRRLDDVLFGPETPARLLVVQGGFMVLFALRALLSPYPKLTPAPAALFDPVPFLSFLDRMPSRALINALQAVVIVSVLVWFWIGRDATRRATVRRVAFAVAWLGMIGLSGLRASRGKIHHIELIALWAALPLVFAPGDATFSDRVPTRRTGWPIRSSIGIVSACYFLTGFQKLAHSGLDWVFSDNMKWALAWGRVRGEPPPLRELGVWIADHAWLAAMSAGFILLFEISFPLVLVFRRVRPAYVAGAWLFHGGTFLLLGLDYSVWIAVVTILLVDWPPLLDRLPGRRSRPPDPPPGADGDAARAVATVGGADGHT